MSDMFVPAAPVNATIRELFHGIMLKQPGQLIPLGAGRDILNFKITSGGIQRASAWNQKTVGVTGLGHDDFLIKAELVFTDPDTLEIMFFGHKFLYRLISGSSGEPELERVFAGIEYENVIPTAHGPGTLTWDATANLWNFTVPVEVDLTRVNSGDVLDLGARGMFNIFEITGQVLILSDESLVIADDDNTDFNSFTIEYRLRNQVPWRYQVVGVPGNVFLVDRSSRGLLAYNSVDGLREIDFATWRPTQINAVAYHDYRLWLGGFSGAVGDASTRHGQRLVWSKRSSPLQPGFLEIEDETFFVDLVGPKTEVLRIEPLGNLLIVYFLDSIFFGRPTNIVGLPYNFEMINTGGLGLVGKDAICSLADGHYFVGRDDVYFLSAAGSLEKIGSEVLPKTIETYRNSLAYTQVIPDLKSSSILFLFFDESMGEPCREIWAYNYEFRSWTRLDVQAHGLTQFSLILQKTWQDFSPVNNRDPDSSLGSGDPLRWDAPQWLLETWGMYKPDDAANQLFLIQENKLFSPGTANFCDARGSALEVIYESGDIDFQVPDMNKTATRLTLKLEEPLVQVNDDDDPTLDFVVQVSNSRGTRWRDCGILRIRQGQDEGKINFVSTGSLFRFRIKSTSRVMAYRITEFGVRARTGGLETFY